MYYVGKSETLMIFEVFQTSREVIHQLILILIRASFEFGEQRFFFRVSNYFKLIYILANLCLKRCLGEHCNQDVDECASSPCKNAGTCINQPGSYLCVCVNGWTSSDCSVNIDDCASQPCYGGGTCVDRVGTYKCICPPGKTGSLLVFMVDRFYHSNVGN
jgi:Calcium-binding EGF domain/EGF-like domain